MHWTKRGREKAFTKERLYPPLGEKEMAAPLFKDTAEKENSPNPQKRRNSTSHLRETGKREGSDSKGSWVWGGGGKGDKIIFLRPISTKKKKGCERSNDLQ